MNSMYTYYQPMTNLERILHEGFNNIDIITERACKKLDSLSWEINRMGMPWPYYLAA